MSEKVVTVYLPRSDLGTTPDFCHACATHAVAGKGLIYVGHVRALIDDYLRLALDNGFTIDIVDTADERRKPISEQARHQIEEALGGGFSAEQVQPDDSR